MRSWSRKSATSGTVIRANNPGNTVRHILDALNEHHPASVSIAALLFKPEAYKQDIPIEHVALRIPNAFVVGSGLDHDGLGRNLPGIYRIIS